MSRYVADMDIMGIRRIAGIEILPEYGGIAGKIGRHVGNNLTDVPGCIACGLFSTHYLRDSLVVSVLD